MTHASNRAASRAGRLQIDNPMTDVAVAPNNDSCWVVLYFVEAFRALLRRPVVPHAPPAEAAIPICAAQHTRLGRLRELAAVGYAYSVVVFTGTVVYALMNGTTNYEIMTGQFAVVMTAHGARNIAGPLRRLRYSRG